MTNTDITTRKKQITTQLANSNCTIVIIKNVVIDKSAQVRSHLRGESVTPKHIVPLRFLEDIFAPES